MFQRKNLTGIGNGTVGCVDLLYQSLSGAFISDQSRN